MRPDRWCVSLVAAAWPPHRCSPTPWVHVSLISSSWPRLVGARTRFNASAHLRCPHGLFVARLGAPFVDRFPGLQLSKRMWTPRSICLACACQCAHLLSAFQLFILDHAVRHAACLVKVDVTTAREWLLAFREVDQAQSNLLDCLSCFYLWMFWDIIWNHERRIS